MLPLGLCPLFALLLWKLESAAGAVTDTRADIPTSPPNNSEVLVPTLLSFSLEQDRWPGSSTNLCRAFTLTVTWARLGWKGLSECPHLQRVDELRQTHWATTQDPSRRQFGGQDTVGPKRQRQYPFFVDQNAYFLT
jgi:hypothetical protein